MLNAALGPRLDLGPVHWVGLLPLILGIGLVFGVHVVHRLLLDPTRGILRQSAGPAIALSAILFIATQEIMTSPPELFEMVSQL